MKEGLVKTLLRHVFGIFPVVRNALRHGDNLLPVTKNQFLESAGIAALCGGHQNLIGTFVRTC